MRHCRACLFLTVILGGCHEASPERIQAEARSLRRSIQPHRAAYLKSIELENALAAKTLDWLRGPISTRERTDLASEARRFMDDWARVYFMPREMHAALLGLKYDSGQVRAAHASILKHLKQRYFTLHDYQRYAQYTSESDFSDAPPGRVPKQLAEMRMRLETHPLASDEITPVLAGLP